MITEKMPQFLGHQTRVTGGGEQVLKAGQ
jgi:hypothetical protein